MFKKGNKLLPNNYRSISLTCLWCKFLNILYILTFFAHLNQANILCEEQHGFRETWCCESQLIVKIDDFAQCLAKWLIHTIFLDFTKAFDKVPHKKLCHKLASYSITGPVLQWISDFDPTGGGQISDSAVVLSGVPQGTVLRTLLFLCYINNLPRSIKSTVRMYADALLCTMLLIVLIDDCTQLQNNLLLLEKWENAI